MRMMRSGGLRAVADAALYLPLLEVKTVAPLSHCLTTAEENSNTPADRVDRDDDDEVVRQLTRGCTLDASQHVDQLAHIITEKMSDGSDFFQLLQDALGRRLRTGEKYHHLRLFYLLVPSMCIDFVAYLVREKEQLVKKNKEGVFTDDGFALGCSFLISLFGVQEPFQSLHWFDTVRQHFIDHLSEIEKLVQGQATHHHRYRDNEAGNVDAAYLTRAVVEMNLKQHVEVEEAFTSSRVFFYKYNSEFSAEADDFGEVSDIDDENTEYSSVA
ncbi:hypothetical protein AGDE_16372 [Angomonas deanei]|nr:hypothetical protein AGDE_16372 [Angomonas deanei]|eukprot:EPY17202.1 hypothetical protein AGDE_16372 [Angomonas deanei]